MEEFNRETILTNIDTLIEWTIYEKLKDGCIERRILSHEIIEGIETKTNDINAKHEELIRKIAEGGPDAFRELVQICESNFWDAADFLESFENTDTRFLLTSGFGSFEHRLSRANVESDGGFMSMFRRNIPDRPLELYTDNVDGSTLNVTKAVQFCSKNILTYSMKSKNRGVLFLVNIIEIKEKPEHYRNGAIKDKINLITLFREFGFKIFYYENLTLKEFHHLVDELIKSKYLRLTDSLVFSVLSHGCFKNGHQMIQFSDGKNGSIEDIITKFSNSNCENLIRKPKIFIFPMCRGISRQIKIKNFGINNVLLTHGNIPPFSDIKICYGTVKGFSTFRDEKVGSWYILAFCETLAAYAHTDHFDDLHKLIGQRLEFYCQERSKDNQNFTQTISSEDLGFTQHLFFNPGIPALVN